MFSRLKDYDLFATIVGLRYKGSWRYQTTPGALCSLIYIIIILLMIFYFTQDYLNRSSINLLIEEVKYSEPPLLETSNDFIFALVTDFSDIQSDVKGIIEIGFEYIERNRFSNKTVIKQLGNKNCTEQFIQVDENAVNNNILLKNGICVDTSNLSIQGNEINQFNSFIRVKLNLCRNSTTTKCKSESEINSIIETMRPKVHLLFIDSTLDSNNPNQYFRKTIKIISKRLMYENFIQSNLYFSKSTLFVQEGLFYETDTTVYNQYTFNKHENEIYNRTFNSSDLLIINLMSSDINYKYHLSYPQIWQIFANLSGVLNAVYFVLNFGVYYINNMLFQMEFINDTYRIKNKQTFLNKPNITKSIEYLNLTRLNRTGEKLTINKPSSSANIGVMRKASDNRQDVEKDETKNDHVKNDMFFQTNNVERINEQSDFIEGLTKTQNKIKLKSSNENLIENLNNRFLNNLENDTRKIYTSPNESDSEYIDFKIGDIISISFCLCFGKCNETFRNKVNIYRNINDYLNSWQDFSNIFKKLIEIDLLKYLLLDNDQLTIFKSLLKPQLYIHTDPKYIANLDSFSKFYNENVSVYLKDEIYFTSVDKKERDLLKRSILNLVHKRKMTELDEKLIRRFKKI